MSEVDLPRVNFSQNLSYKIDPLAVGKKDYKGKKYIQVEGKHFLVINSKHGEDILAFDSFEQLKKTLTNQKKNKYAGVPRISLEKRDKNAASRAINIFISNPKKYPNSEEWKNAIQQTRKQPRGIEEVKEEGKPETQKTQIEEPMKDEEELEQREARQLKEDKPKLTEDDLDELRKKFSFDLAREKAEKRLQEMLDQSLVPKTDLIKEKLVESGDIPDIIRTEGDNALMQVNIKKKNPLSLIVSNLRLDKMGKMEKDQIGEIIDDEGVIYKMIEDGVSDKVIKEKIIELVRKTSSLKRQTKVKMGNTRDVAKKIHSIRV